jgi:hypothetical protein
MVRERTRENRGARDHVLRAIPAEETGDLSVASSWLLATWVTCSRKAGIDDVSMPALRAMTAACCSGERAVACRIVRDFPCELL